MVCPTTSSPHLSGCPKPWGAELCQLSHNNMSSRSSHDSVTPQVREVIAAACSLQYATAVATATQSTAGWIYCGEPCGWCVPPPPVPSSAAGPSLALPAVPQQTQAAGHSMTAWHHRCGESTAAACSLQGATACCCRCKTFNTQQAGLIAGGSCRWCVPPPPAPTSAGVPS